ncbi:MAG: methylated-DNA--[Bacteroidaceae bacterium]|nr:methylated-DNA--[protein]-cysteine S-methyltransferase [Bacteroidaceae bacterium]
MDYIWHYDSPLGDMTMGSDGESLTGLWFDGQKFFRDNLCETAAKKQLPVFEDTCRWLEIYFSGRNPGFMPSLKLSGTPFRMSVWRILLSIPYGHTLTYGDIARQIAAERGVHTMSAQAVGGAVGHNPISIIVPCHRVIGTDGSLTGYAGGMDRKILLLRHEAAVL